MEAREWNFDTWIVARDASTGLYYTMTPPLHELPPDDEEDFVHVSEGGSLTDMLNYIRDQRSHWQWPTEHEIRATQQEENESCKPDSFHTITPSGQHRFTMIVIKMVSDTLAMTSARPYILPTLKAFE